MTILAAIAAMHSPAMLATVEAHALAFGLATLGTWIVIIAAHALPTRRPKIWN